MQFHLLSGSCVECKIKFAAMHSPCLTFLMISVRQYAFKTLIHILTFYRPVDGAVPCCYMLHILYLRIYRWKISTDMGHSIPLKP